MATRATVVEQWSGLSVDELATRVRKVVKEHDGAAAETWARIRVDPVLSAKVRGALSRLAADVRGSRDEAMWMLWISQARGALAQKADPITPEPVVAEPTELDDEGERSAAALLDSALAATSRPTPAAAPSAAPPILFHAPGA
jgi:hypothetical protein